MSRHEGCSSKHTVSPLTPGSFSTHLHFRLDTFLPQQTMAAFVSMATCHTCNKVSRQPGMNRELLSSLSMNRSTPGSAGKHRTPQSVKWATPKSIADRTPSNTPRSTSSNTSSSSSKSSSAKSSPFARLKKILMLENKQQNKKGGLKDFLSSL